MDEASVLAALTSATDADGAPLVTADDVAGIAIEDSWILVVLRKEGASSKAFLAQLHRYLVRAFPSTTVELRADNLVYRGGAGFGEGRHVVAVLGGKGGVGKSTVAVNLAITFWAMGMSAGLLDGDLNAPDIPHMLGVHPTERPRRRSTSRSEGWRLPTAVTPPSKWRKPYGRHGLEIMSVGFVVPEKRPMALTERWLVSRLLNDLIFQVSWTANVLLIDAPPGTGEEIQVMARELPLSAAIFVTTPQDLAQMDAERTLGLLRQRGVPVIGMVQNMASLTCPHCVQEIDLYAESKRLEEAGVPILGRIPFDTRLSVTADRGTPLVLSDPRGPIAYQFAKIGSLVRRWLFQSEPRA